MIAVSSNLRSSELRDSETVPNPSNREGRIRAVLFDLDGTMYRQKPMRALMAMELITLAITHPLRAPVSWRVLSEYRKAQEALRGQETPRGAAIEQLELTARRTGLARDAVDTIVAEWMLERPLKHLPRCRATGLLPLLDFLTRRGIKMGVFSDYPPELKLQALGVGGRFSVVLCSSDPAVGLFKPHPRGFLEASARWKVDPAEVLVVGDRPDADAAGAAAAGMPCVIVGRKQTDSSGDFVSLHSLERLRDVLDDDHSR